MVAEGTGRGSGMEQNIEDPRKRSASDRLVRRDLLLLRLEATRRLRGGAPGIPVAPRRPQRATRSTR
jgi:hypothetical protein